jgi:hypothetical protein
MKGIPTPDLFRKVHWSDRSIPGRALDCGRMRLPIPSAAMALLAGAMVSKWLVDRLHRPLAPRKLFKLPARKTQPSELPDDIGAHLLIGSAAVFVLVGGLGAWAATSSLAGAVVAPGIVVVDSSDKKVQHPTGGVVAEIRMRDGDKVNAGDLVMRLDDTITRANLGVITSQLDELAVRQARLKAERDGLAHVDLPANLNSRADSATIQEILAGERALFESRQTGSAKNHN